MGIEGGVKTVVSEVCLLQEIGLGPYLDSWKWDKERKESPGRVRED
jgi:hypothetical protein